MTAIWRLRAGLLTLVGALVVHEARYLLAPPEHGHEGVHRYLNWLMPVAAALLFVAVVQLAVWVRRSPPCERPALPSLRGLWLTASASLVVVFGAQEALELTAAYGEPPALGELLEQLGWQLVPLSVAAGGLLALLLKGAAHVVRPRGGGAVFSSPRPARPLRPRAAVLRPRGSVLGRHLAGRGPPAVS